MNTVKVISSSLDSLKRRVVKFLRLGNSDIQTSIEVGPANVDSSPIKDMVAIYAETAIQGSTYIIGYVNKNQIAKPGEYRTYSTDEKGKLKFYTWMKGDGTMELGGTSSNLVRYSELNLALQAEVVKINSELAKISAFFLTLGITYTVSPITIDISPAKINELKTL